MDDASRQARADQMGYSREQFYRGEPNPPDQYNGPTYFSRDKEYSDGFAQRSGQPEAREFRLKTENAFRDYEPTKAASYARLVQAAQKHDPELAANLVAQITNEPPEWLMEFARRNPDFDIPIDPALTRHAIQRSTKPTSIFRDAGFDLLDSGRDVLTLSGDGIRHASAAFDPRKANKRNIFYGAAAGAATPLTIDQIRQYYADGGL